MSTKSREPGLMSNGCRERTEFVADEAYMANNAFPRDLNPGEDIYVTEAQFLDSNTPLARTCSKMSIIGRLKAGGYYTVGEPIIDINDAKFTIDGVWKYKNGAKFSEVESHPLVSKGEFGEKVCQQRAYEPTNEPGACIECPVRVELAKEGKDCLYAGMFFPRESK